VKSQKVGKKSQKVRLNTTNGSARLMSVMKKNVLKPMLAVVGASFLLTGCVVRERTVYTNGGPPPAQASADVEVDGPPPADQVDTVVGVAPAPGFVWVGGFYGWGGGRWVWHAGYWGRPPHPGAVWVHPYYAYRGGRHYYVRGYWR
jgi:hypothetical protein